MLIYLFLERKRLFKLTDKKLFFSSIISLTVVFFFLLPHLSQYRPIERLPNFSLNQPTVQQRITVWKVAWQGIKERPFLGGGPENFSIVFSEHYNSKILSFGEEVFDRAYNLIFDILAGQGFLGLLWWLVLIVCLFRVFIKSKNYLFCSLIVAYMIHNFFFFDLFSSYLMLFILFGLGIYADNRKENLVPNVPKPQHAFSYISIGMLLSGFVLSVALVIYANIKPALANFYSTRGYTLLFKGEGNQGLDYFLRPWATLFGPKTIFIRNFPRVILILFITSPNS